MRPVRLNGRAFHSGAYFCCFFSVIPPRVPKPTLPLFSVIHCLLTAHLPKILIGDMRGHQTRDGNRRTMEKVEVFPRRVPMALIVARLESWNSEETSPYSCLFVRKDSFETFQTRTKNISKFLVLPNSQGLFFLNEANKSNSCHTMNDSLCGWEGCRTTVTRSAVWKAWTTRIKPSRQLW